MQEIEGPLLWEAQGMANRERQGSDLDTWHGACSLTKSRVWALRRVKILTPPAPSKLQCWIFAIQHDKAGNLYSNHKSAF